MLSLTVITFAPVKIIDNCTSAVLSLFINSNTTSGYEIAGNFRSQIRVFVSATIFTSERSEQVKIVLRNKYEWSEEKISGNFVPTSLYSA
jgi:hypothetical protein